MKTVFALAVAGCVLSTAPAFAASAASNAFIANARPNVIFLDESSRLALNISASRTVRGFAYSEAKEQTIAANSMTAWVQTNTVRGEVAAIGAVPVTGLIVAPVDVAAGVTDGIGNIVTGRSVALDAPLAPLTVVPVGPAPVGSQLLPAGQDDLARLRGMSGRQFDSFYKATQIDALRQLATLYRSYQDNGDDPALRAIATRELPKVEARIRQVNRL